MKLRHNYHDRILLDELYVLQAKIFCFWYELLLNNANHVGTSWSNDIETLLYNGRLTTVFLMESGLASSVKDDDCQLAIN